MKPAETPRVNQKKPFLSFHGMSIFVGQAASLPLLRKPKAPGSSFGKPHRVIQQGKVP
jgi:hypothetical protein